MFYKRVLIICDNIKFIEKIREILESFSELVDFTFKCSDEDAVSHSSGIINVKKEMNLIIKNYDLVLSVHCRQIFPAFLVKSIKCINLHPGYCPYNRGWYPHVFSMINKMPAGATIHEMDEEVDHGPVIARKQIEILPWENSAAVYQKIVETELELFQSNIENILKNHYQTLSIAENGNINYRKDFHELCHLDLNETGTFSSFIDKLRALTHHGFQNAYFVDPHSGKKIFMKIILNPDDNKEE